jgi:hypothetical protein
VTFNQLPIGVFLESLQDVFWTTANSVPDTLKYAYQIRKTDRYRDTFQSFAGLGNFNTWDGETAVAVDTIDPRFEITLTQAFWRKAVAYTWKNKKYAKYNLMRDIAAQLGLAAAQTKQVYGWSFLNNQLAGAGDVWCAAEGQYFFSTAHPLASGGSYGNLIAGALSESTLTSAFTTMRLTEDDQGIPMNIEPQYVFVHPSLEPEAWRILNSIGRPGTANNDVNYLKDRYKSVQVISVPYITNTNAWFVRGNVFKTVMEVSVDLETRMYEEDTTRNTVHDACFAFQVGAKDWRGWVGSSGA